MGVGNWSLRSFFKTDVIQVDSMSETFEAYRERALDALKVEVASRYPDVQVADLTLVGLGEMGLDAAITDLIEEFPFWDDEGAFARDNSQQRYADLKEALEAAVASVTGKELSDDELKHLKCDLDKSAAVVGLGRYAQVVLREWESDLYVGIAPTNKVEDGFYRWGDMDGSDMERLLGKCLSWIRPDNKQLDVYRDGMGNSVPKLIELENGESLFKVSTRVFEKAEQLEMSASDAAAADQFFKEFGVTTAQVMAMDQTQVEYQCELIDSIDATPTIVKQAYAKELDALSRAVLNCMAELGEEPYRPSGAWTSKKVDLSPYRHVAAVQLDAQGLASVKKGELLQALECDPWRASILRESEFDRTVVGAIQNRFPVATKLHGDMYTLYERRHDSGTDADGVLVWRGHRSWGQLDGLQVKQAQWLNDGRAVNLGDLPQWMALSTDGSDVSATLDGAPQALAQTFYDAEGSLDVTGVLAEVGDGDYRSLFVTNSSRPFAKNASYEAVLFNGQWKPTDVPTPSMEVSRG